MGSDSASDFLCLETAQHCQQAQAAEDAARAEAEAAREAAERAKAEAEAAKAEAAAAQVAAAAAEMEKAGGGAPAQQEQVAEDGSAAVATAGSVKREEL